jgi:hypothetical protein
MNALNALVDVSMPTVAFGATTIDAEVPVAMNDITAVCQPSVRPVLVKT